MRRKIILASIISLGLVFFAMTAGVTPDEDVAAQLEQAKNYYESRDYEKAEQSYQSILNEYSGTDYAFQAQKGLTMVYIAWDKLTQAESGYEKLLADFSENEQITQAAYEIAETYRHNDKFDKSLQVYQDVLDKWPGAEQAIWAQRSIAISNIALDKTEAAQAAVDKLLADYFENANITEAVFNIADTYYWFKHYQKANEHYQYVLDTWPAAEHAMWAQMGLAISNIADGNDSAAHAATERLITDFNDEPKLPEALFYIAGRYEWSKKFEQAKSIYQQISQQFPDSPQAGEVPFALARINVLSLIEAGDNKGALMAIDDLIIDFNDRPDLYWVLSRTIAERYYYERAFQLQEQGLTDQATDCFQIAATIWEKVIKNKLAHPAEIPHAYYRAGDCYRKLGKYKKSVDYFQKLINDYPDYDYTGHAQFLIGECYEKLRNFGALPESEANPLIEQAYKLVVERYPDCKAAKYASLELGRLNFESERWADAVHYLEISLKKYPENQGPHYILYPLLGRAYEKIGKLDLAAQAYREFIKMSHSGNHRVKAVKLWLEELGGYSK